MTKETFGGVAYRLLPDGGFVVGDIETRLTAYAYPTSTHATEAKRHPKRVALRMQAQAHASAHCKFRGSDEWHMRNWAKLEG